MNASPPPDVERIVSASKHAAYKPPNRAAAFLLWPLWWVLDPHTGRPSTVLVMAWAIYVAFLTGHPIPATVCAILMAAAIGREFLKQELSKIAMSATSTDAINLAVKHETTHAIAETIERKFTNDGVPALSNPHVDGAKTPAGDD